MMMKIKKIFLNQHQYFWLILAILLICILVLQIVAAQIRSFWEDEAYTAWLITRNLPVLVQNLKADVNSNPPLYWLLVFFWSKAFGTSELGIRSFSILWMTATCLLTYKLARDMFDERTALTAVILLTFSPLVLTYGHNARYYSMAAALALLLILMMLNYINTGRSLFLAFLSLIHI